MAIDYHKDLPYITADEIAQADRYRTTANAIGAHTQDLAKQAADANSYCTSHQCSQEEWDNVAKLGADAAASQVQYDAAVKVFNNYVAVLVQSNAERKSKATQETVAVNESIAQINLAEYWKENGVKIIIIVGVMIAILVLLYLKFKKPSA